jgi:hypothetical protein
MKAKEFIPASKPRNFVVKHQKTAGAGAHRDKKKEQKQGYEKHRGKDVVGEQSDDWGGMSHREFKRRELQHELGHEDDPDFERKLQQQQMDRDRGPWYIKIDGKIYKQKGGPKVFDWKKGANNYALAILKNRPELQGKILITKKNQDDISNSVDEGWREKLAAAALAGTIGLGAAGDVNARVLPGADPSINRLTGEPVATQQIKKDTEERKNDFSTEYLKKVVDGKHPRPMISVDDAKKELERRGEL